MVSDDDLMDMLVLKGGTALDIVHRVSNRLSIWIFRLPLILTKEISILSHRKIEKVLKETFKKEVLCFLIRP